MRTKINFLEEKYLQRKSEFESGMVIGSLHLDPAYRATVAWTHYDGEMFTVNGRRAQHIIECSANRLIVVFADDSREEFVRADFKDSIVVYKPVELS